MRNAYGRAFVAAVVLLSGLAGVATPAVAQAVVPPRGVGAVTVEYQGGIIRKHLTMTGPKDSGRVDSQGLITDFSIGVGRGFAVSLGLPAIDARYVGDRPHTLLPDEVPLHPGFVSLDDGRYHASFQDVHAEVRRAFWVAPFAVTPFVGSVVPSHGYEYLSHAAVGRHVRELQVGVYTAGPIVRPPNFFQVGYVHGFEQTVIDIPRQRDVVTFEAVHFLGDRWRVYGGATGQVTHGGIDIQVSARELRGLDYINHDRIVRTDLVDVGGGTAYELTNRITLLGSLSKTVWGINGHAQWITVNVGMSYAVGPARPAVSNSGAACHSSADYQNPLQNCVCLRK